MNDPKTLVSRLRRKTVAGQPVFPTPIENEAADRIEALEFELVYEVYRRTGEMSMVRKREPGPYVFESDEDGHFYVIPKARMRDWAGWLRSDDAQNGIEPDWADAIGGAPSLVSFPEYSRE